MTVVIVPFPVTSSAEEQRARARAAYLERVHRVADDLRAVVVRQREAEEQDARTDPLVAFLIDVRNRRIIPTKQQLVLINRCRAAVEPTVYCALI